MVTARHSVWIRHAVLAVGIAVVLFPIYVAAVAASHELPAILHAPMSLVPGMRLVDNFAEALSAGTVKTSGEPVAAMLLNSFVMAVVIIVAEPLVARGVPFHEAREDAAALLARLNIPPRLWPLPPATFSGGEQQRINIARGFAAHYPVLLLDEPTASLDEANQAIVVELIRAACFRGAAVLGIFHDPAVRDAVADRVHPLEPIEAAA